MQGPLNKNNLPDLPRELYWKEYTDPIKETPFHAIAVKSNAYTVRSRGTDFGADYEGINPLYYSVVVAPSGFAAEDVVYKRFNQFMIKDRDGLMKLIKPLEAEARWLQQRDVQAACLSYERAFMCLEYMKLQHSEMAGLAMKASWVYKELIEEGDDSVRQRYDQLREFAIDKYLQAYEGEDLSKMKMGYAGIAYLIAELMRQRGKFDDSLRWFGRVVTDKGAVGEVKRQARNQMDLCKEQREAAKASGDYSPPEEQRMLLRSMYQLYRDQGKWLQAQSKKGTLSESELLRAILDGVKDSKVDISQAENEEQLAQFVAKKLGDGKG